MKQRIESEKEIETESENKSESESKRKNESLGPWGLEESIREHQREEEMNQSYFIQQMELD